MDWKSVGKKVQDEIWKEVQDNLLNVSEEYRAVCMRSSNTLWKDHKSKTKINYFEKNKDDPDLVNNPLAHIVLEQWADLVAHWSSEDAKMQQIGEETDKMSVWKKARDMSNPEVAEAIADYEERLLKELEDQRNLKDVKDRVFHSVMGDDGYGYCRTYGSSAPRNFVYPQSSSPSANSNDLVQKITKSIAKHFEKKFERMEARLNSLENKERNHNRQVLDASSGYETDQIESIGEQPHSPSAPSQPITEGSKQV